MTHRKRAAIRQAMFALAVAVVLAAPGVPGPVAAHAHVPDLESNSTGAAREIEGPEVSRALYGFLAPAEEGDLYRFRVGTAVTRPVSVLVPAYAEHAEFRPSLTVFADGRIIGTVGGGTRRREWEPFSLTTFWMSREQELAFEPGVEYQLAVRADDEAATGRYVIVFGGPESFRADETLETFGELPRIWFGAYGGAPVRLNALGLVALAVALVAIAAPVLLVTRLFRRRLRSSRR